VIALAAVLIIVLIEVALVIGVRSLRRDFQWLITEADELPEFDRVALDKFLSSGFDPHLGWTRRPNTTGREKGKKGEITFHIDDLGARASATNTTPTVAAFGDSYVFCRQVEDDETWEELLGEETGTGVLNFGVGNYGADQGLLRYETTALPSSVRVVILGFVPETICRIHSYWKHYLEFGNTFAFKPRFTLTAGGLAFHQSAMQSPEDFARLPAKLSGVQVLDEFYRRKFRSLQFRSPYLVSLLRHPARHLRLISSLVARKAARAAGRSTVRRESTPFSLIMQANIRDAHRLYREADARSLLRAVLLRFRDAARERGHIPVVLVIPQLIDLRLDSQEVTAYHQFFSDMSAEIPVLEMTSALRTTDVAEHYIEDQYGGHLSRRGNQIVATQVASWLRTHIATSPTPVPHS
jgi:hypothetical protein